MEAGIVTDAAYVERVQGKVKISGERVNEAGLASTGRAMQHVGSAVRIVVVGVVPLLFRAEKGLHVSKERPRDALLVQVQGVQATERYELLTAELVTLLGGEESDVGLSFERVAETKQMSRDPPDDTLGVGVGRGHGGSGDKQSGEQGDEYLEDAGPKGAVDGEKETDGHD